MRKNNSKEGKKKGFWGSINRKVCLASYCLKRGSGEGVGSRYGLPNRTKKTLLSKRIPKEGGDAWRCAGQIQKACGQNRKNGAHIRLDGERKRKSGDRGPATKARA